MASVSINGIRLSYERYGQGIPLVLLHGYPLDHSLWDLLAPRLENKFDLIMPDLRGFGETPAAEKNLAISDYASDLAGLLNQLNIHQAAVAGHSMGGYVALAFARAYPERLLGLGLVSSQALADTPDGKAGRYKKAQAILSSGVREEAEAMSAKLSARPELQAWSKQLILRQSPAGMAGALRAMAERPDSTGLLAGFSSPLVLVHGLADALIQIERARSIKAAAPGAQLIEILAAGHLPMMEAPQETAEALLRLL